MKTPNNKTRTRGEQETETTYGNSYIHFNLQFMAKAALICEQVRSLNFFKEHSPFSLFALVLPSLHFFASFLPPPYLFLAVSPSSLNRSSPLQSEYGVNSMGHVNRLWPVRASVFFSFGSSFYIKIIVCSKSISSFFTRYKIYFSGLGRFSIECRKTKTKVFTLANHGGLGQTSEPIKTRSK